MFRDPAVWIKALWASVCVILMLTYISMHLIKRGKFAGLGLAQYVTLYGKTKPVAQLFDVPKR